MVSPASNRRSFMVGLSLLSASCASTGGEVRTSVIGQASRARAAPGARPINFETLLARRADQFVGLQWHSPTHVRLELAAPGEATRVLLIGLDGATSPGVADAGVLSPDGRALLVGSERNWRLVEGGAGVDIPPPDDERVFLSGRRPQWSRDGRYAAFVEVFHPFSIPVSTATHVNGVPVIDFAQLNFARRSESRITIIDRNEPLAPRRIPIENLMISGDWGADNLFYGVSVVNSSEEPYTEILRFDAEGGVPRAIYRSPGRFQTAPAVSPDGATIALPIDADNRSWDDFTSIVLIDVETGHEKRLTRDLAATRPIWSRDGREIFVSVRAGGLTQIWVVPLEGEPRQLTRGARRHFDVSLSPDGANLVCQTEDGYGRRDVRAINLATGVETVLHVVDEPALDFPLGEWRHIRWQSTDGVHPYGYLFFPPDFDPSRTYPMLVDIHGGGPGSSLYLSAAFSLGINPGPLEWHVWAALGYVVLVPDYRSTGDYGPKPISARRRRGEDSALDDFEDAVTGVEHVLRQGYIDRQRIAVLGHSAGGPRAYAAAVSRPDLFSALIVNEGIPPDPLFTTIASLSGSMTGSPYMGVLEDMYGATMAEAPRRYDVNMTFRAAEMRTPTLIMMGTESLGGAGRQPWEIVYSILRDRGVPAELLVFTEEGHGYSRPESASLAFNRARAWLDTNMPRRR